MKAYCLNKISPIALDELKAPDTVVTDPAKKEELEAKFVSEAKKAGLENLKGHRSVGGMRASIYNAMPKEGVTALVNFMKKFESENL